MTKIIYTETVLNTMLRQEKRKEVDKIVRTGKHRNRKCGNYIIVKS